MSTGDFTLSATGTPKDDTEDKEGKITYNIGGNLRLKATNSIINSADNNFNISAGKDYHMSSKAFSSNTHSNTGHWLLGANNSKAYLDFNNNNGEKTQLVGQALKLYSTAGGGIEVRSDVAAEGIKMVATAIKDNETDSGVSFSMIPSSGGNSHFFIRSGTGTIESSYDDVPNIGKRTHVNIGHGILTNWGEFQGTPGGNSTTSIFAARDVRSLDGWMYANEFYYNGGYSHNCMGANRSSSKVSDHLGCIYDLLNYLQNKLNQEIQNRQNDVNDARRKANAAQASADTAQATANSKLDTSTFNEHTHRVNMEDNQHFWAADSREGKATKFIGIIAAKASVINTSKP